MADVTEAGILTTASDVLFTGGHEGYFFALDARNGKLLWKAPLGGEVRSGPMTYMVNGRQYVAVDAGNSLFVLGTAAVDSTFRASRISLTTESGAISTGSRWPSLFRSSRFNAAAAFRISVAEISESWSVSSAASTGL